MSRAVPICHLYEPLRIAGLMACPTVTSIAKGHEVWCIGSACSAARWCPSDHLIFCGLVFPVPSLPPEGACWEDPAKPATVREGGGE